MFARMQIDVTALQRALRELPDRMRRQTELEALRAGARVVRDEARARAPVDTGNLRDSIVVRAPGRKQKRQGAGPVIVGFELPHGRRAHLAEFGTARHGPQPFLRPAIDAKADAAIAAIGERLGVALARNAAKLETVKGRKLLAKKGRRR